MRPLYRRLLEIERAALGEAEPRPETPERIAAAEAHLGRPLPPGYRAFLEEVGSAHWPLTIGNVLSFHLEAAPWPDYFVPFADDGGGNLHGFDRRGRKTRELPILYWDHEEPELPDDDDTPAGPTRFEAWLEEQIEEEEHRLLEERRRAIAARLGALDAHAITPDRAQVEEVEARLGVTLPADYVWFTTTFGSARWPVRIAGALELADLTAALRARWPKAPVRTIAFAEEDEGAFAAFGRGGAVTSFGLPRPAPTSFLAYLEDRLDHAPPPPPAVEEDAELALAHQLLRRLRESGALETTRGFDPEPVARAIADAWERPARILDILVDRRDVIEVYASADDLAALQRELAAPER